MDRISQLQLPPYTANPTARAGGSEEALKKKSMDIPLPNAVDAPFKKKATALEGHPPKRHHLSTAFGSRGSPVRSRPSCATRAALAAR